MTKAGTLSATPIPGMPHLRNASDRVRHMLRQLAKVGVLAKGLVISLAPDLADFIPLIA